MLQDGSVKNVGYTGDPHVYFSILYAKGGTLKETNFLFIGKDLNYGMLRNIKKKHWMTPNHPVPSKEEVRLPVARVFRNFLNYEENEFLIRNSRASSPTRPMKSEHTCPLIWANLKPYW